MPEDARLELFGEACKSQFDADPSDLTALRDSVSGLLDMTDGGFSQEGQEKYGRDEELGKVAAIHRTAVQRAKKGSPPPPVSGEVQFIKPGQLRLHPLHGNLYRNRDNADLIASISLLGLIEPLICIIDAEFFVVVSGSRRLSACIVLGMTSVPSRIVELPAEEVDLFVVECNRQRRKTHEEISREFGFYLKLDLALAHKRQLVGIALPEIFPEGGRGDARDGSAERVDQRSGRTLEKGWQVVQIIDRLESEGNTSEAEVMREALNRSFDNGMKEATRRRHLPAPSPKTGKGRKPKQPEGGSEKSDVDKKIDEAILTATDGGLRMGLTVEALILACGHGVRKADISRWIKRNVEAGTIKTHSGSITQICRPTLTEERQELMERIDQISRLFGIYGDAVWRPA